MINEERLLKVILSPHISEKATRLKELRQYVFEVIKDANKPEIKAAVEYIFKTKVKSVRVLNVKSKKKRFRNMLGHRKGWKKAYVTLEENQAIEFAGT